MIRGSPGCGKTTVAKILYKIWTSLDIFENEMDFEIIGRSDMVGSYMGHTANKTKKLLKRLSGSVIFIDEAYALCNGEKDDYGREALDVLTGWLSEEKEKSIVILAGYEKELEERVFASNPGLKRRFGWYFIVEKYTADELYRIFVHQLKKYNWTCDSEVKTLFETHHGLFINAGGDTENVAFKAKLCYAKENWKRRNKDRRLTYVNVKEGIEENFSEVQKDENYNHLYI